ncbi:major histocompatibility complex class I ZBA precursor [Danio rerio]|uniref:MHC class I antigen ZBA transcript variant 1 n=1 Tax=Danio rerio TaxID=7955 RepID=A8E7F4_DANRE|nr:major histocompatibility complex class I ZBA precursor [Danio rerio]AAI54331.1 Zgc:64115 protein [Danio rerio]AHA37371.1 MHC class I antigen ZBA transcript variant 1 [Danio rerio]|eukprot:NP_001103588.1 major histocompatibility complex class I ZE like precursor [Danio rerio]
MGSFAVLFSAVMLVAVVPAWTEKHSLYYIYTALSRPVNLPGIYEFTAMGLLDDRQIDYYNSEQQKKIPKQHWMKEKMQEDYWEKGTQSRKSKEQWFNVNVNILMERMRHNKSDVHVLQWRHGCEIESQGNDVRFSRGIDEYSYDGRNFLSFDDAESQWVAPVEEALPTKRKWDNVPILNQYTKGYLEKECVDWLNKFREYGDKELREGSSPEVHVFAKRIINGKIKLKLTCLATGFYPKDVILNIRKYRITLPDNEVESTGVRPNEDGTFQLRKSINIYEDEKAEYDCYVSHTTLKEPIIKKWDGECLDGPESGSPIGIIAGAIIVVLVVLAAIGGAVYFLRKRSGNNNVKPSSVPTISGNKDEKCSMLPGSDDSGQGSSDGSSKSSPTNSQEKMDIV